jgi:hypothetical protein
MGIRAAAGGISNALSQAQDVSDPCYRGNSGAFIGAVLGGALSGVVTPGAWGTSFTGSFRRQVSQGVIAGLPASGVSSSLGVVGDTSEKAIKNVGANDA